MALCTRLSIAEHPLLVHLVKVKTLCCIILYGYELLNSSLEVSRLTTDIQNLKTQLVFFYYFEVAKTHILEHN